MVSTLMLALPLLICGVSRENQRSRTDHGLQCLLRLKRINAEISDSRAGHKR